MGVGRDACSESEDRLFRKDAVFGKRHIQIHVVDCEVGGRERWP